MLAFEFYIIFLLSEPYLNVHFNGLPAGIMNHYRDMYGAGQNRKNIKKILALKVLEWDMYNVDDVDYNKVDASQDQVTNLPAERTAGRPHSDELTDVDDNHAVEQSDVINYEAEHPAGMDVGLGDKDIKPARTLTRLERRVKRHCH